MSGYAYLWSFQVAPQCQAEFERIYGPDGDWAQLFRRAAGYRGTWLLRDVAEPGRYVTVDRWQDEAAWQSFRTRFAAEYQALDQRCEGLTLQEQALGRYTEPF
jgi:heme-degrading monooxygenase HmoA